MKFTAWTGSARADEVARLLLEHGPATAAALAERLGLTPAAVRRHLDALVADGLAERPRAAPAGAPSAAAAGRPGCSRSPTPAGAPSTHAYDDLAASALRFLAETGGGQAVAEFARRRVAELEAAATAPVVDAAAAGQRVEALAEALSADGYAASAPTAPARPRASSSASTTARSRTWPPSSRSCARPRPRRSPRLLGTHVQRLATIAHGDGVCTTHVPTRPVRPAAIRTHVPARRQPSDRSMTV